MAYTPTNWKDGDIISAEKMNKLEQGVAEGGGGVLLVNVTESSDGGGSTPVVNSASPMLTAVGTLSSFTANKTYAEVDAAVKSGKMVYLVYDGTYIPLINVDGKSDITPEPLG